MIGQHLVKAIADEPADRDIDLRLAHQLAVMHNAEQQARQHQPHGHFRIDARPAILGTIKLRNLLTQPREIEDPVDPGEDVIVGHQLPKRTGHEQLQLTSLLAPDHPRLPRPESSALRVNQPEMGFSTAPAFTSCATCSRMPARAADVWSPPPSRPPSPRIRPRPRAPNGARLPTRSGRRCRSSPPSWIKQSPTCLPIWRSQRNIAPSCTRSTRSSALMARSSAGLMWSASSPTDEAI